jgi:molecular chaperone GrpE
VKPGPGPADSQGKSEKADTPEEKLRALRKERDAIYERWLRSAADLENYRKRIDREREEFRRAAIESVGIEMIQVLDNFDRAMSAIPPGAPPALVAGVRLIHKQILDLLARRGLVPMEKAEGPFDPHRHEAVATEVREDVPPHHVLEEIQRGYVLQGRVLRPALVKVSVRAGEESPPAGEAS